MCSRVLATTFIIYCLNTGFCEDLLDLSCNVNEDCENYKRFDDQVAVCFERKCNCSDRNGQNIECKPVVAMQNNVIRGPCPCKMLNSYCDSKKGICLCEPDYVPSYDKRRCIKEHVSLNEECEDNSQCVSADHFSHCDPKAKACKCLEHHIELHGECLSAVALDENCQDNVQCANRTKFSMCSENKCVCSLGFVANDIKSTCLPSVGYHSSCSDDNQCKHKLGAGSTCDYICVCDSNHFAVNESNSITCRQIAKYGDYCKSDADCSNSESKEHNFKCYLGECRCHKDFYFIDGLCQSGSSGILLSGSMLLTSILSVLHYI